MYLLLEITLIRNAMKISGKKKSHQISDVRNNLEVKINK